jgi:2-amino-4-hydroxy-6-hydroxymethyldihydropteridine diphosphokinase
MPSCLIGLGSNLGDRRHALDEAIARLQRHPRMTLTGRSPWQETRPVGGPPGQPGFLNGAAVVETSLPPQLVLEALQQIEWELGRRQAERWGPRIVDLDLLLYSQMVLNTPSLVLPHPRMAWRRFVLQPAASVAGSMVHPTTGWTIARLLNHLDTSIPYVAITGSIGAGKSHLAARLAERTGARQIRERPDLRRLAAFYADPAGQAWQTELEFLRQRARLLAADLPAWSDSGPLAVSDFWFDQSAAFARVWLSPGRQAAFRRRFERLRARVVRPRLIVLLDAPRDRLARRVHRRGRRPERSLSGQQLERIAQAILARATQPDQGPLMRVTAGDPEETLGELVAAVEAMQ